MKNKGGFTLIELLLVIGIIAVLAVVVFVALDPAKRFQDARDARRLTDIQNILTAVQQYIIDNRGSLPSGVDGTEVQFGTAGSGCELNNAICSANSSTCLDASGDLARYLKTFPYDAESGSSEITHYTIQSDANNIITIKACDVEGDGSQNSVSQ